MLPTLSKQESFAVQQYDDEVRTGKFEDCPMWADEFSQITFIGFRDHEEIVDIGCGLGRAVPVIKMLGIKHYFGIDPSEERVKYCRKIHPNHTFEVDEIKTLGDHYPERFSGFWLTAVLMHIPRTDLDIALNSLRRSLKPDSPGFYSTPQSDPDVLEETIEGGMTLTMFRPEEIIEAFERNGFRVGNMMRLGRMLVGNAITT